jgi:hypothetical protein
LYIDFVSETLLTTFFNPDGFKEFCQ